MKETVMENYIYLCWAQLWAMTFWYHDPEEKRFRFNQLLNVLDRLGQYEVNFIFNDKIHLYYVYKLSLKISKLIIFKILD